MRKFRSDLLTSLPVAGCHAHGNLLTTDPFFYTLIATSITFLTQPKTTLYA